MYALIRQYEGLDATTRETATKKANVELRPILTKAPGFVSYELVESEDKDGAVTSISVFDTRDTRRGLGQACRGVGACEHAVDDQAQQGRRRARRSLGINRSEGARCALRAVDLDT